MRLFGTSGVLVFDGINIYITNSFAVMSPSHVPHLSGGQGQPPYLANKKSWESRVVDEGESTTMKCPVQGALFFRWFKVGTVVISTEYN